MVVAVMICVLMYIITVRHSSVLRQQLLAPVTALLLQQHENRHGMAAVANRSLSKHQPASKIARGREREKSRAREVESAREGERERETAREVESARGRERERSRAREGRTKRP
ncbi:hypothetical protein OH77DRAFT_838168 [Trametes cingulata]|nr:hypothetical protein OH77DRAFT_838168 [Trametes cingulata]